MRSALFKSRINVWRNRMSPVLYCNVVNVLNSIRGKKHRISPVGDEQIFLADDGQSQIHFCRRLRGNQFKRGVMQHLDMLAKQYCLDQIDVVPGGVFIDCGANIGEMGLWAQARGLAYIAFEPEALEARCCDLNNFDGNSETRREALWKEATMLTLYSMPESADSSVFEVEDSSARIEVPAVALDDAVDLSGFPGTVVFKVEAEGAEPEVLEGAARTLALIDWVTVDCGYERGKEKAHTFVETNVFLHDQGFRLHGMHPKRVVALYRNMER